MQCTISNPIRFRWMHVRGDSQKGNWWKDYLAAAYTGKDVMKPIHPTVLKTHQEAPNKAVSKCISTPHLAGETKIPNRNLPLGHILDRADTFRISPHNRIAEKEHQPSKNALIWLKITFCVKNMSILDVRCHNWSFNELIK